MSHGEDQPILRGALAAASVVLICAGVALLVFGIADRSVSTGALGLAFIFGAILVVPT